MLQSVIDRLARATPEVEWSICVIGDDGRPAAAYEPTLSLRTASVGKVLLLIEYAAQLEDGDIDEDRLVSVTELPRVGGSGLLQYLRAKCLSLHDLAVLVAAVSDNDATNVLLEHVGLERVQHRARALGLTSTALLDQVRSVRGPGMPPTLSTGSAAELAELMAACAHDELVSGAVSRRLRAWLRNNTDTTMVAANFDLDPLEHNDVDGLDTLLFNKTGTDDGTRADVGWAQVAGGRGVAYAAIANWDADRTDATADVLEGMHALGEELQRQLAPPRTA